MQEKITSKKEYEAANKRFLGMIRDVVELGKSTSRGNAISQILDEMEGYERHCRS